MAIVTMQVQVDVRFKWYFNIVAYPCVIFGLQIPSWAYVVEVK